MQDRQQQTVPSAEEDRLTFPPFPDAPPGADPPVSFTQFKERGIQLFATDGDDIERDGLGIPTVPLRVRHDTDKCKTETRRHAIEREKQNAAGNGPKSARTSSFLPGVRRDWWDEWADEENSRTSGPYNPNSALLDRLYEAGSDFRRGRSWPSAVSTNWDQFRLFIGMLSNTPVWTRTDKPKLSSDSDPDMDDEEILEAELQSDTRVYKGQAERQQQQNKRIRPRPPYALYNREPIPVSSEAEVTELVEKENVRREECMIEFLDDPAGKIKIFLSSYMRSQGLLWYDRNLVGIPRLLAFWVNYLLRNRVFPEHNIERGLRRSLKIIDLAQRELILTSKLSKQLPDKFGRAVRSRWGAKAEGFTFLMTDETKSEEPEEGQDDDNDILDEDAPVAEVDGQLPEEETSTVPSSGWSTTAEDTQSPWGQTDTNADMEWTGSWGGGDADNSWTAPPLNWTPSNEPSLKELLGTTALRDTHTTGIVEWSVRRIKSVVIPEEPTEDVACSGEIEDPDAVDAVLEKKLARIVLEPWGKWDRDSEEEVASMAHPRIMNSSRGSVFGHVDRNGKVHQEPTLEGGQSGLKPHDPFKDEITLMVERTAAETGYFSVGMGIGATWVQMVHNQDLEGQEIKSKKKQRKKGKVPTRYWYVDEVLMVLPSFYT